ncbi:uncharacterized protein A4U43_C10F4920 [Asparagus officinalis]|uniref:Uncharacterized protein n=1 Tax=Asparagus officinalis TaxID=4686 RepID=A0A5P1E570_ASPOF|nr:uncharacterized protein A4U43_C10F4920 [Asparagus officinalis]
MGVRGPDCRPAAFRSQTAPDIITAAACRVPPQSRCRRSRRFGLPSSFSILYTPAAEPRRSRLPHQEVRTVFVAKCGPGSRTRHAGAATRRGPSSGSRGPSGPADWQGTKTRGGTGPAESDSPEEGRGRRRGRGGQRGGRRRRSRGGTSEAPAGGGPDARGEGLGKGGERRDDSRV